MKPSCFAPIRGIAIAAICAVIPANLVAQTPLGQAPPSGDVVIGANTIWSAGTYQVNSLTVESGATLTIGGGSTVTVAAGVTVTGSSSIVLQGVNTSGPVNGTWQGTGVTINAASLAVDAGSSINADGQGYIAGALNCTSSGAGPGGGPLNCNNAGNGGSYGGLGAGPNAASMSTYGSQFAPVDLGSGGSVGACGFQGCSNQPAGAGGGAVRLVITGMMTLNGVVSANGGNAEINTLYPSGAGAGGSVYVTAGTLTGSGTFSANGGTGVYGGGGGRVAVYYSSAANYSGFNASAANGGATNGQNGTVLFANNAQANLDLNITTQFSISPSTTATYNSITVNNGGTLTIGGGSTINVTGLVTVTGSSSIVLQSINTSAQVSGQWAGQGVTINAGSVQVDPGSSINADGQGYLGGNCNGSGSGPGGGPRNCNNYGNGGSYGGLGGGPNQGGMSTYGSASAPVDLGSGGSGGYVSPVGGAGGGAVRLAVSGALTNNGTISANGGYGGNESGAGSGGSVYVTTGTLTGSGVFLANGGGSQAAVLGGGGGRVAVYYASAGNFTGFTTSTAAGAPQGGNGSVIFSNNSTPNQALYVYQQSTLPANTVSTFDSVTVENGGTLTIGGGATLQVTGAITVTGNSSIVLQSINTSAKVNNKWQGSGVTIDAASIQVDHGSSISADGQGYTGSGCGSPGSGPGGAPVNCDNNGNGGSYGGLGAGHNQAGMVLYGSASAPVDLGSGGSGAYSGLSGAPGGGAMRLVVSSTLTNNGTISASGATGGINGGSGTAGSGSGGSVYVTTATLAGSGVFLANGGGVSNTGAVGGGGGRIAVYYTSASGYSGFTGSAASGGNNANVGTMLFADTSLASPKAYIYQNYVLPPDAVSSYDSFTVTNGGNLTMSSGAQLNLTESLTVTGNSTVTVLSENNTAQVNGKWAGFGGTISAGSMQIDSGSAITADGQGYAGSNCGGPGSGPGGGPVNCGNAGNGGSYGGLGGGPNQGSMTTYGSASAPTDLGSGGSGGYGYGNQNGVAGGGAIRLVVAGTLTNNGQISANGSAAPGCAGGGSGGSVYVTTATLAGAGTFQANGGAATGCNAGGGGGRVAVYYTNASGFTGFAGSTVSAGTSAQVGTAIFADTTLANPRAYIYQNYVLPADSQLTYDSLTVTNGGNLTMGGGSKLTLTESLTLSNNATVTVLSKNNTAKVNGQWIGSGGTIQAANLQIDSGSTITADAQGYTGTNCGSPGNGPGGGQVNCNNAGNGGSYGGTGGGPNQSTATTYGSNNMPVDLGSGGSGGYASPAGAPGGGAIRLIVTGTLTNNGVVSANGAGAGGCSGGGSGGSIYASASTLAGAGVFQVNGGSGSGCNAGGAGGRVAVYYYINNGFNGASVTATGVNSGQNGTVVFSNTPQFRWVTPASAVTVLHGSSSLSWAADAVNYSTDSVDLTISGPLAFTAGTNMSTLGSYAWDTTTAPDGRYSLRLVLHDNAGNVLNTLQRSIVVNNTVVWHSGTITSNQEWSASQVHGLDGIVYIASGVTLTIDPGAVVKALPGSEIVIESGGVLNAAGTQAQPVIFTTFDDSSQGGDTDYNAGQTLPSPGEWQGISVQTGGQYNSNSYTQILYTSATLSGTLTASTTLLGSNVYQISGNLVVPSGITLTLMPGSIVKFDANAGIDVQSGAQLVANGTTAQPIYLTSIKDDSVGGDTNNDGSATSPAAGDWGTILIDGAQASMTHVNVLYGAGPINSNGLLGMIQTSGNATLTLADSVVARSFWVGLLTGYPIGGDTATVTNTIFYGIQDRAINAWPGSTVHVVNDTFDGNGIGVMLHGGAVDIANSIIANSKGDSGWGSVEVCCGSSLTSMQYSDVWSSVSSVPNYGGTADLTGTSGNISANPVFVNEPQNNFQLNYGSPAIDAASGTVANYPLTDAMGNARYNDPLVANKTGVADTNGNYPDMGALEFLKNAPSDINLSVSNVQGPTTVMVNSRVQVSWTVTNIGTGVAYGPWHDAVYLITGPDSNPVETYAGTFLEGVGAVLGPGGSYSGSATITVPGTVVGNHHWEVKTNVQGEIFEGQNAANNAGQSLDTVAVDLPELVPDAAATNATFSATGQSYWYKVVPGAGKNIAIKAALASQSGSNQGAMQLFIGQGYIPSAQQYDEQQVEWNSSSVSAAISNSSSQTYYVTAYAQSLPVSPDQFTISASTIKFALTSVSPGNVVNAGNATLTFNGGGFTDQAAFQLVDANAKAYNAASSFVSDATTAKVTFTMTGMAAGTYSAKVTENGVSASLPNAISVTQQSSGQASQSISPYTVSFDVPQAVRAGFPALVSLNYQNVSSTDQIAPLIYVAVSGATLTPVPPTCTGCNQNFYAMYSNSFSAGLALGINHDGAAGILPAGAGGTLQFLATPTGTSDLSFSAQVISQTQTQAPWDGVLIGTVADPTTGNPTSVGLYSNASAFCAAHRPANVSQLGFNRVCMQFLLNAGYQYNTASNPEFTGAYLDALGMNAILAGDATALSKDGIYVSSGQSLLLYEFNKEGLSELNQRYHQGAFGYGTSDPFDMTAGYSNGAPTVFFNDGSARVFSTPAASGTYLGSTGDYGSLTINGNGTWTMTDKNGLITHFVQDPLNSARLLLDYVLEPNGNKTSVTYTNDLVTRASDSKGNVLTYAYDSNGHISQMTDVLGRTTTFQYDVLNDSLKSAFLTAITTTRGTTTLSWNEGGSQGIGYMNDSCITTLCTAPIGIASITNPDATHTYYTYDSEGRTTGQSRDGGAERLTVSYNADGSVTTTDALGNSTTNVLNQDRRIASSTDPSGAVTSYSYDPEGKPVSTLLPNGSSYQYGYDNLGNMASAQDPLGYLTTFSSDSQGKLHSVLDGNGNGLAIGYDGGENVNSIQFADGSTLGIVYDSASNPVKYTNRRGHTTTYAYNSNNLRTSKTYANGSQVTYTYDAHNNLQTVTDPTGTTTFTYDAADRITRASYSNGRYVQYGYNQGGQHISTTDSTGYTASYTYDQAGRISTVTENGVLAATYSYDAAGRILHKTLGNGTTAAYTYDANGRITKLLNASASGAPLSEYDYTYDSQSDVVASASPSGNWTYGYDPDGQLISGSGPTSSIAYAYDAGGNRIEQTEAGSTSSLQVNSLNELTSAGSRTYRYDADGNVLSDGNATYTYDDDNRITGIATATDTWTYQYNGVGDRVSSTHNGVTTYYLYDLPGYGNVLAELNSQNALMEHFIYGPGLVGMVSGSGAYSYYHFDANGNTVHMTNAAGTVTNNYAYLPFGAKTQATAGTANPFTYSGMYGVLDDGTGLYQMRNRSYDPQSGRFMQVDPIGLMGSGTNMYNYGANNPLKYIDPLGLDGNSGTPVSDTVLDINNSVPANVENVAGGGVSIVNGTRLLGKLPPSVSKFIPGLSTASSVVGIATSSAGFLANANKGDGLGMVHDGALVVSNSVGLIPGVGNVVSGGVSIVDTTSQFAFNGFFNYWYTPPDPFAYQPPDSAVNVPVRHSADPNGKLTTGYGTNGYIAANAPITYTIYFENQATATAPAQIVTVTDPLDPNLDWTTVQLSQIQFNNVTINVPGSSNTYSGQVNVTTDPNPVKVNASLNPATGTLSWVMKSVDPVTGLPPADPTAGFLPPNNSSNQGTGYLTFTVLPKSSLANAAVISNQASIVFDVNAAIATNTTTNTIDSTTPTSAVSALPASTTATSFTLSWSGSDSGGSGIASYTIFESVDGGPYSVLLLGQTGNSATFTGTAGHTYSFYTMATNNVGNVQVTPGTIQTTQILQTFTVTPSAGGGGTITPNTPQTVTINNTTSFTVTPNSGYQISSVTGCGGTLSGSTYTTGPITGNCNVTASFAPITFTVTPSAGAGGSITPSTPQTVIINNTTSFTVTPNTGFQVSSVTGCGGTLNGSTYTTGPITASCAVTASFTALTFTVTPSAGAGGSITPSTPQTVTYNNTTSFTVTANSGYQTSSVTGCGGSLTGTTYTTGPITASCNVTASFIQLLPVAGLSPSTLTFTAYSGTTSAAQTVTLSNTGNAPLTITSISLGGTNASSFTQTNTCSTSVAAGSNCTISVKFSPAATGSFSATLSVIDNAAGSPHTSALSGTATLAPTFTVSATPSSATVNRGGAANYSVTVTAQNGTFPNAVVLTATGIPTGATVTFLPASVTPGSTSATSTLTIQTSSTSAEVRTNRSLAPLGVPALALLGIFFLPRRVLKRWLVIGVILFSMAGLIGVLSGCGGSSSPPQTYTITVTGTSGTTTSSSTVSLTVN